MVHFLDRGFGLVLDYSLWHDPVCCERRSGLGCYAGIAKLRLKADVVRNGHTELYQRFVLALIHRVVLMHEIFVFYGSDTLHLI